MHHLVKCSKPLHKISGIHQPFLCRSISQMSVSHVWANSTVDTLNIKAAQHTHHLIRQLAPAPLLGEKDWKMSCQHICQKKKRDGRSSKNQLNCTLCDPTDFDRDPAAAAQLFPESADSNHHSSATTPGLWRIPTTPLSTITIPKVWTFQACQTASKRMFPHSCKKPLFPLTCFEPSQFCIEQSIKEAESRNYSNDTCLPVRWKKSSCVLDLRIDVNCGSWSTLFITVS